MSRAAIAEYFRQKQEIENNDEFPKDFRELIERAAELYPDKLAFNFFEQGEQGRQINYLELRETVNRLADGLQSRGIVKGCHVAVIISNRIEYPITWLGLAVLGAVMIPVNPSYTASELDYVLDDSDAEFVIIEEQFLDGLDLLENRSALSSGSNVIVVRDGDDIAGSWGALCAGGDAAFVPSYELNSDDLLNIQYTSGTTGFPKGCMQSQRYWILLGCAVATMEKEINSVLADAPFFYMDPQWMVVMGLYGGKAVHFPKGPSVKRFLDWVETYGIEMSYFPDPLLGTPPTVRDAATPLKKVLGYALNAELTRLVEKRFNVIARDSFGMTEIGPGLVVPDTIDSDAALDSCGLPTPFRQVKIVDEDGHQVGPGVAGELWVKGDGIIRGYYKKPDANQESFVDGWFRTGDLFVVDEHGFYTIVGRLKDMVRRSSENISALEVESAIRSLAGIENVAVVAVPDAKRGEEVKAYLVLSEGMSKQDISPSQVLKHARKRLAPFKVPRYLEYLDDLPLTPSQKVAKRLLLEAKDDLRTNSWDELDKCWR